MKHVKWLYALAMAMLLALQAGIARADPQVGWWWNPNESGRGFFIESAGGTFYMAAYFYADDGRARWLVSGGSNADPYHYSGQLLDVRNGQTLFGPYVPPGASANAGAITVNFSDDTHGTIVWPGGTIPIVREIFDTTDASFQPEPGWWWNPAESGSGYSIEVQGGTLFMVGFMYDGAGNPIWYLSAGPMASETTYQGDLVQVANGQTLSGPYHPPSTPVSVGTLAISFTAPDAATLTFNGNGSSPSAIRVEAGPSRTTTIQREFTTPIHSYTFPPGYDASDGNGLFFQTLTRDASNPLESAELSFHATGKGLHWNASGAPGAVVLPPGVIWLGAEQQKYVGTGGSVEVTAGYISTSLVSVCSGGITKTFAFVPFDTVLTVTDLGEYQITIGMQDTVLKFSIPVTCKLPIGTYSKTVDTQVDIKVIGRGVVKGTGVIGSFGPVAEPNATREGRWIFFESH